MHETTNVRFGRQNASYASSTSARASNLGAREIAKLWWLAQKLDDFPK
jgi:hypothetical protein